MLLEICGDAQALDSVATTLSQVSRRAPSQLVHLPIQQRQRPFYQHPGLKQQRDLLVSMPGIGEQTAAIILSEIVNWSVFESPCQLAAYAGLTPRERSSYELFGVIA